MSQQPETQTPLEQPLPTDQKRPVDTPSGIDRTRERKRRQKELMLATLGGIFMLAFILVQMFQFGTGSVVFIALFNLNFVILLGILFVVLRNGMKLLLERRRGVLGSHLRTRLVLSFTTMTLVPCLLMFLVTSQFVKQSVDFWFKDQVDTSMETALEVGRNTYDRAGVRLRAYATNTVNEIRDRRFTWSGQGMNAYLESKREEYNLALIGVLAPDISERNWHTQPSVGSAWQAVKNNTAWAAVREQGYTHILGSGPNSDFMFGILAVDDGKSGYLVMAEDLGEGFKAKLDRIIEGTGEYKKLRTLKRPLKSMLYVTLGVLTALITMGTIWFAFRVAKELSLPIMSLVEATELIAKGDLSIRIKEESATDEIGLLVKSFNRMAGDLEQSRQQLTGANARLGQQNTRLDQQRQYMATVLDNIAAGVVTFDTSWNVSTVNNAACEILGLPLEAINGKNVSSFLPAQYANLAMAEGKKLSRKPDAHLQRQLTLRGPHEDRRLFLNAVALPPLNGQPQGWVTVFEDITELERMQRMSAWREVARRIAHEIKNPLTPIKLSAQRLERKFAGRIEDPVFTQSTQLIVREVEQLQYMVQEFSAFAKIPEVRTNAAELAPLLQALVETFGNSHSSITWKLEVAENMPLVAMDKAAMHRAIMNILNNAAEALAGRDDPFVCITAGYVTSAKMAHIEIADNGPGLTEEERLHIFEPYFSRKKSGTGLGLAIVKSIITDHYGYIRASKNATGGLTMSIGLPLA